MKKPVLGALLILTLLGGSALRASAASPVSPVPAVLPQPNTPARPGQAQAMAAYIGELGGTAKVLMDGVEPWADAKIAQKLTTGTAIRTGAGGSLTVVFTDGSKVKLGPNSTFKIEAIAVNKVAVYIGLGKLDVWVKKLKGRLFQARNPVAVASVRGTIFSMAVVSPTQVMMQCFEGGLSVADNFGRTQSVGAGQQLAASSVAGAAEPPTALPPNAAAPVEPVITNPAVAAALAKAAAAAPETAPAAAPTPEEVPAEETTPAEEAAPSTEAAPTSNPTQEAAVAPPPDACTSTSGTSASAPNSTCP